MDEALAPVFRALADPTRRTILDLLRARPRTTGEIAEAFDEQMTRFAVMKHLAVLQHADLVIVRPDGRQRWNHLNPVPLRKVYERWLRPYADDAARGLITLKEHVEGTGERKWKRSTQRRSAPSRSKARS